MIKDVMYKANQRELKPAIVFDLGIFNSKLS